jgi:hypothetical protein
LAAAVNCEAPGYNYNRPSIGGGVSAGGFGGGDSAISSGGNYEQVAIGGNTQEGLNVDPQLLEQIKQILLREESQQGSGAGRPNQPSSQYGAPQQQYGPPAAQQQQRVVGIVLENTQPAIQVAQYKSQSSAGGVSAGGSGGYPSGPSFGGVAPSVNAPSSQYGAPQQPQRPSSNYGAPF